MLIEGVAQQHASCALAPTTRQRDNEKKERRAKPSKHI